MATTFKDRAKEQAHSWGRQARETYEESWLIKLFSWVLISGLFAALCYVAWLNIAPYVELVRQMGGGKNWLEYIPLLNWVIQAWGVAINTIVGVLIWVLVQSLQCLWILIGLDRRALRGAVSQSQLGRFDLPKDSDAQARRLERKSRQIPYFFIRWGGLLSLGAYVFDLIVGLSLYPPARSFDKFWFALSVGQWSAINVENVWKLLIMLFAFEFILILFIVVSQWIWTRNQASASA